MGVPPKRPNQKVSRDYPAELPQAHSRIYRNVVQTICFLSCRGPAGSLGYCEKRIVLDLFFFMLRVAKRHAFWDAGRRVKIGEELVAGFPVVHFDGHFVGNWLPVLCGRGEADFSLLARR